jgi:DNA-binding response OmpR family regulator
MILLVEDDLPLGTSLQRVLNDAGHNVVWLRTAADATRFLSQQSFELVVLDVVLPDDSGLSVLRWLRERGDATLVLMVTARDSVGDRVEGLDSGADDYLPKPFAIEELLSRIRVLLRRQRQQLSATWSLGGLQIDTARRRVKLHDVEVQLSLREYDLLLALAGNAGRVMTRAQIERAVAASDSNDSNTLDVHVYNLRKKLGSQMIGTVRGVGYVLEVAT